MTVVWVCIGLTAAVSFAIKGVGPALLGRRELSERARAVVALLAPVMLAALVTAQVLGQRWSAVDPTVAIGLVAGIAARLLRASMLAAMVVAVVVTALVRVLAG
jgi:branched-subunit amino acid transport protein